MHSSKPALPLLIIALLSGASALIYEITWIRWFRLLFGNTAYAASASFAAFFAGLAIGAVIFGRFSGSTQRPLRLYAWIELAIIPLVLVIPFIIELYTLLYPQIYDRFAEHRSVFVTVKFILALIAMLPASILIGGTLPPLAQAFVRSEDRLGEEGSTLYGFNTLGAVIGCALAALWLPEVLGVRFTYAIGIGLSLTAAVGALLLATHAVPARPTSKPDITPPAADNYLLLIAFASGFGMLALEVLLIRAVAQISDSSVYTVGAILLVVLAAIVFGAAAVVSTAKRLPAKRLIIGALMAESILLLILPAIIVEVTNDLSWFASGSITSGLLLAIALGGPVLFVAGFVFPLTFRLASTGQAGPRLGGLLAANTIGGILGSIAASFLLLDGLGLWLSFTVLGCLYGTCAIIPGESPNRFVRAAVTAGLVAVLLVSPADPRQLPIVAVNEEDEVVVAVEEGAHGVVSVIERPRLDGRLDLRMKVDNTYTLGGSRAYIAQERAGHMPLLLHPEPRKVLYIGSATGGTASAAVLHPVEEIVLVEIVPEVQHLAAQHFANVTHEVHHDKRTRLVVEDGRNHIRGTAEKYDVVVADLFVPGRPGVGAVYSREHFESVQEHLSVNGVFCQWLPLYQLGTEEFKIILKTFLDVFPDATVWRADFTAELPRVALIGINGSAPSPATIEQRLDEFSRFGNNDFWLTNSGAFWMFYVGPLAGLHDDLVATRINTDDHPVFEFMAARITNRDIKNFLYSAWPDMVDKLWVTSSDDSVFPGHPAGSKAGTLLGRANIYDIIDKPLERNRALREFRKSVAPYILQKKDHTVSKVWPR